LINKDIKPFLLYFLPKGQRLDWHAMNRIVKHFHLAFKGIGTAEIYDILMALLVATIKGYDPTYTEKVKRLVEVIENGLSTRKQFSFADVNRHLDFDCNRPIRLLGRLGFLRPVQEGKEKRITGFVRTATWPPPASFFEKGAIGVAHYIQKWFRFKLQEWIDGRMREIESKEGVYSLENWMQYRVSHAAREDGDGDRHYIKEQVSSLAGEFQDATGLHLAADVSMIQKPLDINTINIAWVNSSGDITKHLGKNERYLLYLVYKMGLDMEQVGCDGREAKRRLRPRFPGPGMLHWLRPSTASFR
jgi:hypothetical protein